MNFPPCSLAALSLLDVPPPQQVYAAAEAGFSHIGLRLIPSTPEEPHYDMRAGSLLLSQTQRALRATGLGVSDVEIVRLTPELDVAGLAPVFALATELGARQVLVTGSDPDFNRSVDRLGQLAALAAQFALTLNLEPMPWTSVNTITAASALIRQCRASNLGLLVDALHFARAGETLETLAQVPRGWLNYWQICDAPARRPADEGALIYQARHDRLPPGAGELALHELITALPPGLMVAVEVPLAGTQGRLSAQQRAALLYQTTRALF